MREKSAAQIEEQIDEEFGYTASPVPEPTGGIIAIGVFLPLSRRHRKTVSKASQIGKQRFLR